MQDIDFDELDRAVSTAMEGKDRPAEPAVPMTSTTPPATEAPAVEVTERTRVAAPERANMATSPAARRSSGRFMDVVHPSSDMRRSGAQPQPQPDAQKTEEALADTAMPAAEPRGPHAQDVHEGHSWPEPIDMAAAEVPEHHEEPEASDEPANEESEPLASPFLASAKIEKRPLGAFSSAQPEPATPVEPTPESVAKEAPEEAPVDQFVDEPKNIPEPPALEESPAPETPEPFVGSTPESTSVTPLAQASIPQQYKEQPASGEEPSGAIYDTESYHQPLAHPAKKAHGWLVVLWILGLIILGGGLGAAVYFFVLPQL